MWRGGGGGRILVTLMAVGESKASFPQMSAKLAHTTLPKRTLQSLPPKLGAMTVPSHACDLNL